MAFFIFVRANGNAGGQFGFALPEGVAHGNQFVDQFRNGAGHALRRVPIGSGSIRRPATN